MYVVGFVVEYQEVLEVEKSYEYFKTKYKLDSVELYDFKDII